MDKTLKKKLLEEGQYRKYMEKRKYLLINHRYNLLYDPNEYEMTEKEMNNCELIRKAKDAQRRKVEDHLLFLKNKKNLDLIFATFNFADFALDLKQDTRKQKIRRLISSCCDDFILNIDYGSQTRREHYHAILAFRKGSYTTYLNEYGHLKIKELDDYDLGFYDIEQIGTCEEDAKKLSRYIAKLVVHSVKVKQRYITVKKGSDYQIYKKIIEKIRSSARTDRRRYEDMMDQLYAISY